MNTIARGIYSFYESRIRVNMPGFSKEFWPYIATIIIAAGFDFVSTYRFMTLGDVSDELHPIIRFVSHTFGPFIGPLIGKLGQLAAILLLALTSRKFARIIFIPVTFIYFYAAWFNIWGVELYTPVFLRILYQ